MRRVALLPLLVLSLAACDLFGGPNPTPNPDEPSVSSVSPENGAESVATDITVRAVLTLPNGDIDESTVGDQTVTLTPEGEDSPVVATPSVSGNALILEPKESLAFDTRYTFAIRSVKDVSGASLAAFSSTFTTVAEGEPPVDPPPTGSAVLEPSAERLIFETQNDQTSTPQTLTLSNVGGKTFTLSSLASADTQFTLTGVPNLPMDIAPGESTDIEIAFEPTSLGPQKTMLMINGGSTPEVALRGLSVKGDDGDNEPSLQWIFDTFDLLLSTEDEDPASTPIAEDIPSDFFERRSFLNRSLGDEVIAQSFRKAGGGDVTIEVLAVYGVDNTPVTEFGWYEAGDAEARNKLFDIAGNTGNAQTLTPDAEGNLTFDPGDARFGFYSFWPTNRFFEERTVYTQDALNTFSDAIPHQVRAYPYRTPDGTPDGNVEENAYVLATEEFTRGYDYNDIVVVVRNVEIAEEDAVCNQAAPVDEGRVLTRSFGNLELQNPSGAPFVDRLVFNRIGDLSGNFSDRIQPFINLKCHDLNVLRLENTGSSTLNINNLTITGSSSSAFTLPNGESSLSIGAGDTEELVVQFVEDSGTKGIREATLQMQAGGETVNVALAGIYQEAPEGGRELYLRQVVEAFGYSTDVGANNQGGLASAEPSDPLAGDEVRSQLWQRAGSGPVYVRQLAALHSCCRAKDSLKLVVDGDSVASMTTNELYGQAVLPPRSGSETRAAELSTTPSGPFEIEVADYSTDWTDTDNRNNDNLGVRLWPAKRNGSTIPDTYIVAQDFVENGCGTSDTANCDFNDNMYLITNIEPVSPVSP